MQRGKRGEHLLETEGLGSGSCFMNNVSDFTNQGTCASCHVTDRRANEQFGVAAPGFFGTDGRYTFDGGRRNLNAAPPQRLPEGRHVRIGEHPGRPHQRRLSG